MFADLPQISALFSSISFCTSLPYILCLNILCFSFSILALSFFHLCISNYIYRVPHMTVCIPQGIWSEQPWLFDFCLLIPLSNSFKIITICTNFNITVGVLFSYWRLANASQKIKNNYNVYIHIVSYTLQFHSAPFLDFGFTGFVFSAVVEWLFCIFLFIMPTKFLVTFSVPTFFFYL